MSGHMEVKKPLGSTMTSSIASATTTTTPLSVGNGKESSSTTSTTTSTATTTTVPLRLGRSLRDGQCQYTCQETGGCKTELVINNNGIESIDITHPW